ncbi:MAG: hypothetical protein OXF50_01970 [Caldilineaceae bacterium]|nr:hypothetical protein [Caldilineaceae bacterium]
MSTRQLKGKRKMKHTILLVALTALLAGCVVNPESIALVPTLEPTTLPTHELHDEEILLIDHFGNQVSFVSMDEMKADDWLLGWALESLVKDSSSYPVFDPEVDYDLPDLFKWMYANFFVATEQRCVENRPELAKIIDTASEKLRARGPVNAAFSMDRLEIVYTIRHLLPEGNASCTEYLSTLPIDQYVPVVEGDMLLIGFGFLDG